MNHKKLKSEAGVSTITCPNRECGKVHALFWLYSSATKRKLMYRCDRVLRKVANRISPEHSETHRTTFKLLAPDSTIPADNLPEELSSEYRKQVQGEAQLQMILMR